MKAEKRTVFWMLLLASFAGCTSDSSTPCGDGEALSGDDGSTACLYTSELIEEGFVCPQDFASRWDLDDGSAVCTRGEDLPPDIGELLSERGYEEAQNSGWTLIPPANNENNEPNSDPNNTVNNVNNGPMTNNGPMNNTNNIDPPLGGTAVTFRIDLTTDIPESYHAQLFDTRGFVSWVRLVDDRYTLNPPCDIPECGTNDMGGLCAPPEVDTFVDMDFNGSIEFVWNGVFADNMPSSCYGQEVAAPGSYTVEFCIATQLMMVAMAGEIVDPDSLICQEFTFDHPTTPEVVWQADFGG